MWFCPSEFGRRNWFMEAIVPLPLYISYTTVCVTYCTYLLFSSQHWEAFRYITEIFILVPALLGLKGNLEMTLASRLSTAVRHTHTHVLESSGYNDTLACLRGSVLKLHVYKGCFCTLCSTLPDVIVPKMFLTCVLPLQLAQDRTDDVFSLCPFAWDKGSGCCVCCHVLLGPVIMLWCVSPIGWASLLLSPFLIFSSVSVLLPPRSHHIITAHESASFVRWNEKAKKGAGICFWSRTNNL